MRTKDVLYKIFIYSILFMGVCLILFPIYITIITALKTPAESAQDFFSFPSSFNLNNFREVINKGHYLRYVFNSVSVTAGGSVLIILFVPMASYAIARKKSSSKFYNFLYYYIIIGVFIPYQVIMIPQVKLMYKFNLMSIPGLIILCVTFSLIQGVFLFVGYIKAAVPRELEESACIDGCSIIRIYFSIVFPLIKPMTATVIAIKALWMWNDYLLPLIILNKSMSFWTLPLFQVNFKQQYTFDYNLAFASFLMAMLPIMLLYAFLQKYIIGGLTSGALKG